MNIYIDNIIYSLQKAGGISSYWSELNKHLLKEHNSLNIKNLLFFERLGVKQNIFRSSFDIDPARIIPDSSLPLALARYLPIRNNLLPYSVFHSSYYRAPSHCKHVHQVVTVHDFIYELHRSGLSRYVHVKQKYNALKKANAIICVSKNTLKDLLKFYPDLKDKKIEVIYNGVSEGFHPLSPEHRQELNVLLPSRYMNYALFIGDRQGYKNFSFAIKVVSKAAGFQLVIVGGKPLKPEEIDLLNKHRVDYIHLRNISSKTLNILYAFASFLFYPSSYEGFGIPVIEAMRAGCPVLALNDSSIAEIASGYELLLSKPNVEEALEKIKYIENNRNQLIEAGSKIAARFSWQKCAIETTSLYRDIVQV